MGCDPRRLSSMGLRRGTTSRARTGCKIVSSILLAAIALFTASTVSTYAQTNWTGAVSSDWFPAGNWNAGVPTAATSANIDTVTPNSTAVTSAGATALNLAVGQNGIGMLVVQSGGTLTDVGGFVGNLPGSQGTVIVSGAGSTWTNSGNVVVGGLGSGTLTIQNGSTLNSGGGGSVGLAAGSTGTVTVTGPGSSWNNSPGGGLNIGSFGTGILTIANGGMVINNTAFTANVGQGAGSLGTVTVTGVGSTWSNSSGVNVGNLGTGTLTVADSGIVTGPIVIATNAGAVGTLNIGAGVGNPAAAPGTLSAPSLAFGAGTGTLNFNHTSASYVFAPAISGNGTVNVFAGTTTLTAANSYGGATNVNAGTLRAGGLNTFSPNSAVTIASGGTLDLNGFSQTVTSITNAGLVNMGTGTAPGTVLTTTNYTGGGGTIAMNTFLASDGSPSDRLLINGGTANGNSSLRINNAGGGGALTTGNGILVVDAINGGTTVPGAFALAGPAVAGPYEYTLFRSSIDASNPQAWYLRSTLNCTLTPTLPECQTPTTPSPTTPNFRVETSLYSAIPSMALLYGRNLLDTLHERMGEVDGRGRASPDGASVGWGRVIGANGVQHGDALGVLGSSAGPRYAYTFLGLQAGIDVYRRDGPDGSRDQAGTYFAIGRDRGRVTHFDNRTGDSDFAAYSLGGYWTHFGPAGWYIDTILQGTFYDINSSANRGLPTLKTVGQGMATSIEGGYPFRFASGYFIEPQAQLVFQNININDTNDIAAQIRFADVNSLAGRIGARFGRTWAIDDSSRTITAWVRPNLWNEFRGTPTTSFSSQAGFVPFHADLGGLWGEINAGISVHVTSATTLYANASYQSRFDGGGFAYNGKIGLRVNW
jgi:outer membrane autotransporter protein